MRNNLIEFRNKLGFSQEAIGEMFGKSQNQWCNYENSKRAIPAELILDIQCKFGLSNEQAKKLLEVS